jgi:serine/threonine protein kinase
MARLIQAGLDFATEGERLVAEELQRLPDEWVIIANKILTTHNGRSFETDFIVVAERHVFLIDEKGWSGRIYGSETIWVRDNGESARSPLNKVDYVAKILAGYLRDHVSGFEGLSGYPVQGCVLLSRADQRPAVRDPRALNAVFLLDDAVESLVKRDQAEGDPGVAALRRRIEQALVDLSNRPKVPKEIGAYEVIEPLAARTEARRFRARHRESGERVLTVYGPLEQDSELRNFYLQEYRALRQLSGLGVAPACLDPFDWSDDFLVIPNELPEGNPLGALPLPADENSAQQELRRAIAAFNALATIHDAGVLHRALGPETMYMHELDNEVRIQFTDFFAARRGSQTIARQLDDRMEDDPYAAPEIRTMNSYSIASKSSDSYTLALVFLERVSGVKIGVLLDDRELVDVPDATSAWPYIPQEIAERLAAVFRSALAPGPMAPPGSSGERRVTASEIMEQLGAILRQWTADSRVERGELLDGRYRVERVLGQGATARTFLATDTIAEGQFTLKQLRRPNQQGVWANALREFNILRQHRHPNLPNVYDVYGPENDVHVKLEYIAGTRLTEALLAYQGELDKCRQLAGTLLSVLEHFETHGLLHRDIKPDNIIFDPDSGRTVLIDFGAATPIEHAADAIGTPGFAPPEAFFGNSGGHPPESTDRYALAVVLFHALTGRSPFIDDSMEQIPVDDISWLPEDVQPFAKVLLEALDPDPAQRFVSATEMRDALLAADSNTGLHENGDLEERVNDWVDQIRQLYRNSRLGNAENRGLDTDFARETYVQTALDTDLLPAIFVLEPRAVFLTGNPGDGKTAFLAQVEAELVRQGAQQAKRDESGWTYKLGDHVYRACYDASEAHDGKSADEQLREKLDGLQGDMRPGVKLTVLVAINDGRLAEIVEQYVDFRWVGFEIERIRNDPERAALDEKGVWVIDLKRRCYVDLHPDESDCSVMRSMLASLTTPERWDPVCRTCIAQRDCPMRRNALALGDPDDPATRERLEYALLLSHLRSERHITVRDLRSGLAYLITGDVSCREVHDARRAGQPPPDHSYWNAAFTTTDHQDLLLGQLVPLDPARRPQPQLERVLFFHRDRATAEVRRGLVRDGEDLPPGDNDRTWLARWKRRLYFDSIDPLILDTAGDALPERMLRWQRLLPYDYAKEFVNALDDEEYRASLLPRICRGITRSDGLAGAAINDGLALVVADSEKERLTVCKQFPLDDFHLSVRQPLSMDVIEAIPEALILLHRKSGQELIITLDLFELLIRFADGLEPRSQELQPLLEDMVPFKNAVQMTESITLTLIEGGERVFWLTQEDRKIVLRQSPEVD